ncbi:hypothetical protein C8F01DRAFT_1079880 [Mycena amicta]|nr:hypothetical protein C8F01DRAFT_1079880 [Mycena amicta]
MGMSVFPLYLATDLKTTLRGCSVSEINNKRRSEVDYRPTSAATNRTQPLLSAAASDASLPRKVGRMRFVITAVGLDMRRTTAPWQTNGHEENRVEERQQWPWERNRSNVVGCVEETVNVSGPGLGSQHPYSTKPRLRQDSATVTSEMTDGEVRKERIHTALFEQQRLEIPVCVENVAIEMVLARSRLRIEWFAAGKRLRRGEVLEQPWHWQRFK